MRRGLIMLMASVLMLCSHVASAKNDTAIFAMGCFWCAEAAFSDPKTNQPLPGIIDITVGYAGGTIANPTYQRHPGYREAIRIVYNANEISYDTLLNIFWRNVDPVDARGQFCDKGFAYTAAIFAGNKQQNEIALASKKKVEKRLGRIVAPPIISATTYVDAEKYHQDYKAKNSKRYHYYKWRCGREQRLQRVWGQK